MTSRPNQYFENDVMYDSVENRSNNAYLRGEGSCHLPSHTRARAPAHMHVRVRARAHVYVITYVVTHSRDHL